MSLGITNHGGETVIVVTGVFDGEAAAKLRAMFLASSASAPTSVVIDFSRAREITDIALAALVDARRKGSVQLRIRGLSERHNRMLRFLSPDGDALGEGR
jgi:anti-anti-sigma regulatory factor